MDRINTSSAIVDANGHRMWQDANLLAGISGTYGNALFFNGVQEELMAVFAAADLTPNAADNTQLMQAIEALVGAIPHGSAKFAGGANGMWTVPAGITRVRFRIWGAGGGGGGAPDTTSAAGGGGGGGLIEDWLAVTPGSEIPYSVGLGGFGGVAGDNAGANGGDTTFGGYTAGGGKGGSGAASGTATAVPGAGGTVSAAFCSQPGSSGGFGYAVGSSLLIGGGGGPSWYSSPPNSNRGAGGNSGLYPGVGGNGSSANAAGGSGASGLALLDY